jgi:DNA-binding FadR family transcriptional regulator
MNTKLPFKEVKRAHLYQEVADQIQQAIFDGVLKPNESLPSERELVEYFRVGRPVLREALRILQAKGLIDVKPGVKGSTVRKITLTQFLENIRETLAFLICMDEKTINEVWEVSKCVATGIAHSAARNATQQDFDELESLIKQMEECGDDMQSYLPIGREFHKKLGAITGNRVYYIIRNMLHDALVGRQLPVSDDIYPQGPKDLVEENRVLLSAIKSKDPLVINQALKRHFEMDDKIFLIKNEKN